MTYKYSYDPESDVMAITLAKRPFDYSREMGGFIVHFDTDDKPVYIEILNAHTFIKQAAVTLPKSIQKELLSS